MIISIKNAAKLSNMNISIQNKLSLIFVSNNNTILYKQPLEINFILFCKVKLAFISKMQILLNMMKSKERQGLTKE